LLLRREHFVIRIDLEHVVEGFLPFLHLPLPLPLPLVLPRFSLYAVQHVAVPPSTSVHPWRVLFSWRCLFLLLVVVFDLGNGRSNDNIISFLVFSNIWLLRV
jgi:hypothetical protein